MFKNLRKLLLPFGSLLLIQGFICEEVLAIYASPINAGCYVAAVGQCKIHVDPVTINIPSGQHLVTYRIVVINGYGSQQPVYIFTTDQSNPPPNSPPLTSYSPSVVMQDFAATCGATYTVSLQGRDTGDAGITYNLGLTAPITCPASAP